MHQAAWLYSSNLKPSNSHICSGLSFNQPTQPLSRATYQTKGVSLHKPCKISEGKTKYSLNTLLSHAVFDLFRLNKCLQEIRLPSTTSIVVTMQQPIMQQL